MLCAFLLAAQAAAAAPLPDISIRASVDAAQVKVRGEGKASIRAYAEPDGGSTARSSGASTGHHFELRIDARIADLLAAKSDATENEQSR